MPCEDPKRRLLAQAPVLLQTVELFTSINLLKSTALQTGTTSKLGGLYDKIILNFTVYGS